MPRFLHGTVITLDDIHNVSAAQQGPIATFLRGLARRRSVDEQNFDFLFSGAQLNPANLLPTTPQTPGFLVELGRAMSDTNTPAGDSTVPAAYTYFGQFVDHDITLETVSAPLPKLLDPNLVPLSGDQIRNQLRNARTATLDLDNVYGDLAPRDPANPAKLQLGTVTALGGTAKPVLRPAGKDDHNDLPRTPRSADAEQDRRALIGDPRNDENLVVAQLHVAFLRAHNALVDGGQSFEDAQRTLRQHYQHLVLHDFLPRIADPAIVQGILDHGNQVYHPLPNRFFLPLEYSVAAYRFGHSMVRGAYDFNLNFNTHDTDGALPAALGLLFTFTALSGQLGDFPTLPDNWIIEWDHFVDGNGLTNHAQRFDPQLVEPLFRLPDVQGQPEIGDGARLAVRNLLRGYLLRMPTGQAVVRALRRPRIGALGGLDVPLLTAQQIEAGASNAQQVDVLRRAGFEDRTPLWYYILAEAQVLGNGQHLGPVGSTIVAEVLTGLVHRSSDSILQHGGWTPSLPSAQPGTFTLPDLLRFAGVLAPQEQAIAVNA